MARTNPQQKAQARPFDYSQMQKAEVDTAGMDDDMKSTLMGMRGALGSSAPAAPAKPRGDGIMDKAVRWIHSHLGL